MRDVEECLAVEKYSIIKGLFPPFFFCDVSLKWPRASFLSCLFFFLAMCLTCWNCRIVEGGRRTRRRWTFSYFLILFSLRCAFLFGGCQDKCFCPPPTAAKMDIFFFRFRLPSRGKSFSLLFSYPRVLWGLLIQIKEEKKFVFKGLLGSLGRIEKTISKLKM